MAAFLTGAPFLTWPAGFTDGLVVGLAAGFTTGFSAGLVVGFAAGLTAGFVVCFATGVLASCFICFTTGAAKESPPKRTTPARIALNFFMTVFVLKIIIVENLKAKLQ